MRRQLACLALLLSGGCQAHPPASPVPASSPPVVVRTVRVQVVDKPEELALSGTLQPVREATLSTRLSGRITRLSVEEGDRVQAGEVVARVDLTDVEARVEQARSGRAAAGAATRQAQSGIASAQAQVSQARAQLEAARRHLSENQARLELARLDDDRNRFLLKQGAIAQQLADQADTDLKVAQARQAQLQAGITQAQASLERAQAGLGEARSAVARSLAGEQVAQADIGVAAANLDYGTICAPFEGVVVRKLAHLGEMAGPGQNLVQIQDTLNLRLEVAVPENQLSRLALHQRLPVQIEALHATVPGEVRQIVPAADPASRSFTVKLRLANPGGRLIPGLYGRLSLPLEKKKRMLIPATAVVQRGQLEGVMVASQDKAEFRLVKTRPYSEGQLEVLTGLTGSEPIITSPLEQVEQGTPVRL